MLLSKVEKQTLKELIIKNVIDQVIDLMYFLKTVSNQ